MKDGGGGQWGGDLLGIGWASLKISAERAMKMQLKICIPKAQYIA